MTFGNPRHEGIKNMTHSLKQYVPSSVCLKCEGCCRFALSDSPWRPKTGQAEGINQIDPQGYLKTVAEGKHHNCQFFNKIDHTCGIYEHRPFECALYPFILSKTFLGIRVYVHVACPHVQENENKEEFFLYASYLKEFLKDPKIKEFLKRNDRLLHDYSEFHQELRFLFDLGK
jgi:Fe-S-cluster containining protein